MLKRYAAGSVPFQICSNKLGSVGRVRYTFVHVLPEACRGITSLWNKALNFCEAYWWRQPLCSMAQGCRVPRLRLTDACLALLQRSSS